MIRCPWCGERAEWDEGRGGYWCPGCLMVETPEENWEADPERPERKRKEMDD